MKARVVLAASLAAACAAVALLGGGGRGLSTRLNGITLTASSNSPGKPGIYDSLAGKPILSVSSSGVAPGHPVLGSVTITATGGAPEVLTLWQDHLSTSPPNRPNLSNYATLAVRDMTLGRALYGGIVSGFPNLNLCGIPTAQSACPRWAAGESHVFQFTILIPNGSSSVVNPYQGTSLSTDFEWSASPGQ